MKIVGFIIKFIQALLVLALTIFLIKNVTIFIKASNNKKSLPTFMGYGEVVVLSGSMEPVISIDDYLIIKKCNSYEVDDIVTYYDGSAFVTHRIIEVNDDYVITKGDANNIDDGQISNSAIQGKVVNNIKGFGTKANNPIYKVIVVFVIIGLFSILGGVEKIIVKRRRKQYE